MRTYHFSAEHPVGTFTVFTDDNDIIFSLPPWLRSANYRHINYLRAQLTKYEGFKELTVVS